MRCLVFGGTGMLGQAVVAEARSRGWAALGLSRGQADVTDRERLLYWAAAFRPEVIVNCAAFTRVDACEEETRRAHAVNGEAVAHVAAAAECGESAADPRLDRLRLRRRSRRAVPGGRRDRAALGLRAQQAGRRAARPRL